MREKMFQRSSFKSVFASPIIVFVIFVFLAFFLRFYKIEAPSFRLDEAITFIKSQFGWIELLSSPTDNKPPLFYIISKPFNFLGETEAAVRFPAALFGSLAVGASYLLGREIGGNRGGVILALLFLFSDVAIRMSQDARHYSLLSLGKR
jgi:uncharacterized membrane protein